MRNKVITMCSRDYFQYGQKLLDTRHIVDADFVCYGPDLSEDQIEILMAHDIQYKTVNKDIWDTWMQSLKFQFIMDEIDADLDAVNGKYGVTFVDWDTYFLKDWKHIFKDKFCLGITVRPEYIDHNKMYRAWANGGVIFASAGCGVTMCKRALIDIGNGTSAQFPEYNKIWKTLEEGRTPEKTHYRTNKRWWGDQIYLSAIVMHNHHLVSDDYGLNIKLFDCKQYNNMWEETPDTYIMHLKEKSGAPGSLKDGKK